LSEKAGEYVAHFKYTVMILKGTTIAISGGAFDANRYKSDKTITDEAILKLLATPMDKESQKKKGKDDKPAEKKEEVKAEAKAEEKKEEKKAWVDVG